MILIPAGLFIPSSLKIVMTSHERVCSLLRLGCLVLMIMILPISETVACGVFRSPWDLPYSSQRTIPWMDWGPVIFLWQRMSHSSRMCETHILCHVDWVASDLWSGRNLKAINSPGMLYRMMYPMIWLHTRLTVLVHRAWYFQWTCHVLTKLGERNLLTFAW